jgi:hypothetical protein
MWTTVLSALLTPTVAVFGIWIAYRQWRTTQDKLKLDLFDRRLAIYQAAQRYLTGVMTSGRTSNEVEFAMLQETRGAKWLLNADIDGYLRKTLWERATKLNCLQSELEGLGVGEERSANISETRDIKNWMATQLTVLDEKFAPFLMLRH